MHETIVLFSAALAGCIGVMPVTRTHQPELQVLVPVALMNDQPNGGQAYMLVNRDEFPMMAGQPPLMSMQPPPEVGQPKQGEEDGLMVRDTVAP